MSRLNDCGYAGSLIYVDRKVVFTHPFVEETDKSWKSLGISLHVVNANNLTENLHKYLKAIH